MKNGAWTERSTLRSVALVLSPGLPVDRFQPPSSVKTCVATDGTTSEFVTAGRSKFCE